MKDGPKSQNHNCPQLTRSRARFLSNHDIAQSSSESVLTRCQVNEYRQQNDFDYKNKKLQIPTIRFDGQQLFDDKNDL
ncbi:hypothetical protein GJ496_003041 [Pomphorhynchus laevis]|nr:hypothetical protein GJ496_003041 [Pomphorhynchus laevis]